MPDRLNYDITILDFPYTDSLIYEPFPPFHIAGFIYKIMLPLYTRTRPVFGPTLRPPSGGLSIEILQSKRGIRGLILPPTVIEDFHKDPQAVKLYEGLDLVCFAGGPLAERVGDEISKHVALCQFYGSTEMGQIRRLFPRREDWAYIELHPFAKQEMRKIDGSGDLHELVVHTDATTARTSSLNHNYPDVHEWHTKDIFVPHPSKPSLWKFYARLDDIIVFSSGEKLYPIDFERHLMATAGISGALMVGNGRPRAALLLELAPDHHLGEDPVYAIWPVVEEANVQIAAHGRVGKSMVLFSSPEKPFARAAKGTIMRQLTDQLYAPEISKMYEENNTQSSSVFKPTAFDKSSVMSLLRSILGQVSLNANIDEDDNLYMQGLDSVRTAELVQYLKSAISGVVSNPQLGWLSLDLIYVNPTLNQLSAVILKFLNEGILPSQMESQSLVQATVDRYKAIVSSMPNTSWSSDASFRRDFTVALTGSTGFLGQKILSRLLSTTSITRIYCLNRNPNAAQEWQASHPGANSKLKFIRIDQTLPQLGLSDDHWLEVADSDIVIHNAWSVNFNLPLAAYESNFAGLLDLIRLCTFGSRQTQMLFVSSIATTALWTRRDHARQVIPERLVDDPQAPLAIGYAQSKYVAEHIIYAASLTACVPATILRVGLICPSDGAFNALGSRPDIVAALLRSCKTLQAIPSDFAPIDWVTVEQVASVIKDSVLHNLSEPKTSEARFFNLTNPHPLPWASALPMVQEWCGGQVDVVSLSEWVERLEHGKDDADIEDLPALKMVKTFKILADAGVWNEKQRQGLEKVSETASRMAPTDPGLVRRWLG